MLLMNSRYLIVLTLLVTYASSSAQVPLPDRMPTINGVVGFRDGSGYQIRASENRYTGVAQPPNNKTMRYSDRYGKMEVWVLFRDIASPNGMNVLENHYPVGCGMGKMTKQNCHEWSTHIRMYDSARSKGGYPYRDTIISDQVFPIAITNEGLLICSKPKLKGEQVWYKTELKKLTGIYTHDLKTSKEQTLYEDELTVQKGTGPVTLWGLTPNGKLFYYRNAPKEITFWNLETGKSVTSKPTSWSATTEVFALAGVSDYETFLLVREYSTYPEVWSYVVIDNLSGEEVARFSPKNTDRSGLPYLGVAANSLYTIDYKKSAVTFWKREASDIIPMRTVQLDTTYMKDGPNDSGKNFNIQVLTPNLAAVWNAYDRIYIMDLEHGKSKIVYSDVYAQHRYAAEASAAKQACDEKIAKMKFAIGSTIVYQNTRYLVKGYDCYTDQYHLATVKEGFNNPPYSTATITRYGLKGVNGPKLQVVSVNTAELTLATLANKQLEVCPYCHGEGGQWTSEAVTDPSILVNFNTKTAEYKPLGTMVYNYKSCRYCNGMCWFEK